MIYRVDVTEDAKQAIKRFISYIAHTKQEPHNAQLVLDEIWSEVDTLEEMPHRCPKAPEDEYTDRTVRMLIVKKTLLLLYRVDEENKLVEVFGFRHGSMLPRDDTLPEA